MQSSTRDLVKTRPVLVVLVRFVVKLSTSRPFAGSTRYKKFESVSKPESQTSLVEFETGFTVVIDLLTKFEG